MDLTAERVRELLDYDPETGVFRRRRGGYAGRQTGTQSTSGHWQVYLVDRRYSSHRLAWLYVYGEWPPEDIDHIDRDPSNNRIANLRLASRRQNLQNRPALSCSSSGIKGAIPLPNGRWRAVISANGTYLHLGCFDTAEEAGAAYAAAAQRHHGEFACFGRRVAN